MLKVPVLGSLSELPLSEVTKSEVFKMAASALSIVEESDVPTVVRTLLRSMTKGEFHF
jgi:hypothetical protein